MLLSGFVAFAATTVSSPLWMRFACKRNIVGPDIHKEEKPMVPEMGGIPIFFGFALGSLINFFESHDVRIFLGLLSVSVMFAIGILDDVRNLSQKKKFALSFLAGMPLLFFPHDTGISFLFFRIDFGVVYYALILIGVVAASNATNLLAGFNGEEAGCGIVAILSLLIASSLLLRNIASTMLLPIFCALLAFYIYNRYPSRLFCGDCGSLIIGASIASSVIFGKMEILGAIALAPAIAEFFFKLPMRFSGKAMGATVIKNGILHPPPYSSVANILTSRFRLTERKLVYAIFLIQGFFALLVVILSVAKASGHLL